MTTTAYNNIIKKCDARLSLEVIVEPNQRLGGPRGVAPTPSRVPTTKCLPRYSFKATLFRG